MEELRQTLLQIGTDVYQHTSSGLEESFSDLLDVNGGKIARSETEIDILQENEVKAVVSVPKNVQVEAGQDAAIIDETLFNDYEAVD